MKKTLKLGVWGWPQHNSIFVSLFFLVRLISTFIPKISLLSFLIMEIAMKKSLKSGFRRRPQYIPIFSKYYDWEDDHKLIPVCFLLCLWFRLISSSIQKSDSYLVWFWRKLWRSPLNYDLEDDHNIIQIFSLTISSK